ncbi:FCS-Like Zinc finger 8-like [Salvia miltiorrhiza]|uniref:FCS-Like Zinc finger 8-like n=1 Tax=Salvia miltiorrhiza TaxID=226208 RepID=UPI0025ACFC59|nr:FCS-Like Zinc finger 8-like [Salvia miltiorrhiza]
MLRNRSKAVTSKQALMADQIPLLSLTKNPSNTTPISSLISPRFFNGLLTKNHQDSETTLISPKSILDTKNSSPSAANNPFDFVKTPSKPHTICKQTETEAIGLALIDSLNQENKSENSSKPINRMALFGSNLKVQIPASGGASPPVEVRSPLDFGIKTRNSHLSGDTPAREFSRQLSLKEMELSEDYTRVITHGPNPKTTHIFDDCIVESCIGEHVFISHHNKMESSSVSRSSSHSFESLCPICKDSDEKACCSNECQFEERDFEGTTNPQE